MVGDQAGHRADGDRHRRRSSSSTANWHPFAPYGYTGVSFFGHTIFGQTAKGGEPLGMFAGAAIIFFAYIGFDSVSVHSEEAKQPARDVPIGIIASLIICTILYIAVAAVLTGMVPTKDINIDAPVVDAFRRAGLTWMQYLVAAGAMTGITSVLLVMMLSQPRVMLALARDGLVPKGFFGDIHPKFRTPWKSTILTGLFVACDGRIHTAEHPGGNDQHRDAVRFRDCLRRRPGHAQDKSQCESSIPRALCPAGSDSGHPDLFAVDVLAAGGKLVSTDHLAAHRSRDLLFVRSPAQRDGPAPAATDHELAAHGVGGQAVGDPDAPPSSPAAPIDTRVSRDE